MDRRFLAALLLVLTACGSGGGGSSQGPTTPPPRPTGVADINLLFMGNSHTASHGLPQTVAAMVRAARPTRTVHAEAAPDWGFLEDHASNPRTLELLDRRRWSFVVLQAQKYSTSGQFSYPIEPAIELARKSRMAGAVPVMFPEWSRLGIPETQRIFDLHVSIAQREPACVAPVPQAWDLSLARHPAMVLHESDGNHSNAQGAFLAALVIATTITGVPPDTLPTLPIDGVDADQQAVLRRIAAETVLAYSPRQYCPADPL
ncbi:MAG: hypothetical protein ACJ8AU_04310 [Gemmatimonadales bacterium]